MCNKVNSEEIKAEVVNGEENVQPILERKNQSEKQKDTQAIVGVPIPGSGSGSGKGTTVKKKTADK